ncbi:MAG: phage major capsid protein [Lachnospiraceae bacterium]|nr:phage major capsid protein [Lachnospiraceae bacterium]
MTKLELKERAYNLIENAKKEVRELTEDEVKEIDEIKEEIKELDEDEKEIKEKSDEKANEVEDTDADKGNESKPQDAEVEETEDEETKDEKRTITNNNSNIRKMNKEFRLIKAIRDVANNRSMDDVTKAVANAGAEEMRKSGLSFGGQIQLPLETRTITVANEHDDVVETEFTNILEPLRAKNVLVEAGAKYLTNLVGDVQVPIMSATNVGWAGEVSDAASGDPSFSHVTLQPKRLTAYIDLSKQFIAQDSLAAEALIREDLVKAINSKLEATILGSASGDTTQPQGMFDAISATSVASFADVCDKEADIEDANVNGECVYVMSNKAKAAFRNMSKSSKSTQLVMENGEIDGTKAINTSHVEGKKYIYGDFSNLAIGQWGAIDLTVDPYTLARSGQIRLVVNAYFDAKILRPSAFTAGTLA